MNAHLVCTQRECTYRVTHGPLSMLCQHRADRLEGCNRNGEGGSPNVVPRCSAGQSAGCPGRVRTRDGVRLGAVHTSPGRVEGVHKDARVVDQERSCHLQRMLVGGVDDERRAHAAGSLLPVQSHVLALQIAMFPSVARTRPSCSRVHCRRIISGCGRQRGESYVLSEVPYRARPRVAC